MVNSLPSPPNLEIVLRRHVRDPSNMFCVLYNGVGDGCIDEFLGSKILKNSSVCAPLLPPFLLLVPMLTFSLTKVPLSAPANSSQTVSSTANNLSSTSSTLPKPISPKMKSAPVLHPSTKVPRRLSKHSVSALNLVEANPLDSP